ncbi:hypothetical protein [Pseudodesulfovibrio piezophilus]|uniref:Uncharacterized protein n=1 Tax=Pseudodesulfovibrio piezophilus (strain DSM 21447 / JCM 15486 / C1TLV30) TaxID=1322246 RepID=M1WJH0_PSEP2|nr:hypothetical protein [Pseudodesulfovibrio piezophilus]CCH47881.1 protein of unknown function [Pseudodesulfovibrio piezophilus C1TLV30]
MSERSKLNTFVGRKGESWSGVNLDVLPEINFEAIEGQTGLKLNEDIREGIKRALAGYVCQLRGCVDRPLADERKELLKHVEKACRLLESFLEWDSPGTLGEDEYDPIKLYLYEHVRPSVNCFVDRGEGDGFPRLVVKECKLFDDEVGEIALDGKNVSDYLALCRKKIMDERSLPYPSGRPENFAIERCLKWLQKYYHKAGGEGRGAKRSDGAGFSGPFLTFAKLFLDYTKKPLGLTGNPFAESTLGALVINNLKL